MIVPILTLICCESPNSLEQDKSEIEETRRQITENALKENGDVVAEFLTDSIVFSNPNEKDIEGKENVRNYINHLTDNFFSLQVDRHPISEIEVFGNLAYVRYRNSFVGVMKADSSSFKLDKKFMDIWKKEHGKWRMHRHMNSNLPPNQ